MLFVYKGKYVFNIFFDQSICTIQKPEVRAMDLANNRGGVLVAQKLIKNKTYTSSNAAQEALDQLRNKKMSVLKPGLEIPEESK